MIYLPRVEDDPQVSELTPSRPAALRGTETILLEDEEIVRALGQDILQGTGTPFLPHDMPWKRCSLPRSTTDQFTCCSQI